VQITGAADLEVTAPCGPQQRAGAVPVDVAVGLPAGSHRGFESRKVAIASCLQAGVQPNRCHRRYKPTTQQVNNILITIKNENIYAAGVYQKVCRKPIVRIMLLIMVVY
jgi:hypothetical protein